MAERFDEFSRALGASTSRRDLFRPEQLLLLPDRHDAVWQLLPARDDVPQQGEGPMSARRSVPGNTPRDSGWRQ
jgi:hypothetical protein